MAVIQCPGCHTCYTLGDDRLGQTLECPQCRSSFVATVTHAPTAGTFAQTLDQAAASAAGSVEVADAVPGYELLGELGRGGMGVVYRARDTRLNREVALKMILHADADRVTVARFWAEAEVMAAVRHPNVVQVYELGERDGRPFMAMEFVVGGSLQDRLKKGPFSPWEAAELMAEVAAGVGAAHDAGIVHRDLKPGNVLLSAGGPKVTDFGIAKRQAHDLTQTQALMGTPSYMAPEQAEAKAKFVGPPADVWALGVILYECLTGNRPFEAESVIQVLEKIVTTDPPALRTPSRGVPRDLDTIVSKCLSKEPEHRYPTATELAADLGRFVKGEPIAARPVGAAARAARWVRRKPTAAAAWGFSSLAVPLAAVVFVVFGMYREAKGARQTAETANAQLADEKNQTEAARDEAVKQRSIAQQAQKDVEREREKLAVLEYGRAMQVAHQEWRDNSFVTMRSLLDGIKPEFRGWEWRYLNRICDSSLLTFSGHTYPVRSAEFSPDGTRVLTAATTGRHGCGTPRAELRRSCSRRTPTKRCLRRSARMGYGSSPRVRTRRRGCGTPGPGSRCSCSRDTRVMSGRRRSARMGGGSSPPAGTGQCGCGTLHPSRARRFHLPRCRS